MSIVSNDAWRHALRAALLAGVAVAGAPAAGQIVTAAAAADDAEIIVSGSRPIAESLAAALVTQKNSDSLVSVLSADAVGRLPDQNIAQAVSRLPGVSVQRDQGQARYINLRGAPLNWTTLSFDGIYVISPEGRDARYDSIPSALASQVIVQKAVTPDLNGETIAGNVNIVTRSAFDYKGLHVQAKGGAGYVQLGKRSEYEGSLVLTDRFETGIGEIGVVVSGSYYQRNMVTDNFEIDWEEVDEDKRPLAAGETAKRGWARESENKFYELTRRNYSASGKLEWRPDADNKLFISSIYSAFTDNEQRDNYRIDSDDQQSRVPQATTPCPTTGIQSPAPFTTGYADVCTGNTPYKGTVYGVDFDFRLTGRKYLQSLFTNTIGGDHIFGDVTLKWRGNYTKSVDDRSAPRNLSYQSGGYGTNGASATSRVTFDYDFSDPLNSQIKLYRTLRSPTGVFSKGAPVASFAEYAAPITSAFDLKAKDTTDAYTGKAELDIRTSLFGDTTFRFGGQYDQRTKEAVESQLTASGTPLINALTAAGIPTSIGFLARSAPYRGVLNPGYSFAYTDFAKVDQIRAVAATIATFQPVNANYYKVREDIWSGFAMGTTRFDWGNIVYGARVEHIKNDGRAFTVIPGTGPGTGEILVSAGRSQTLVFPSAHINWNPTDEMKVRLSFNTGAARPDYDQLRPSFTISDANQTISGGNPFAKPERARGVDLYWEWYLRNGGFLSVGGFYKKATNVLFNTTRVFNSSVVNSGTIDRSGYLFGTIDNGGDGEIYGVEAAFQIQLDSILRNDSVLGGFGLLVNGTYNESNAVTPTGRKVSFPGTSRWVVNVGPYFEKYGFSARLSYNYRTTWIDSLGDATTAGDNYWATEDELDFSARYAINGNFEVYFDASNLGNGPGRRFSGISARTIEWEKQGRRFTGGVRLTY